MGRGKVKWEEQKQIKEKGRLGGIRGEKGGAWKGVERKREWGRGW